MSQAPAGVMLHRHRITVETFHKMGAGGMFPRDARIELIRGEFIDMAPIGALHVATVNQLVRALSRCVPADITVSVQNPLVMGEDSEPQPDIVLLGPRSDSYRTGLPTARDALLVIEVADTSIAYDREVKLPLYASHNIPEVWLLDLDDAHLEVYLDPEPEDGEYRRVERFRRGTITTVEVPVVEIDVGGLFPSA